MTIRKFKKLKPIIHNSAYIDESCTIIGDVSIGKESSVWPNVVIRGDVQKVTIGERTNIQDGSILHVTSDNIYTPKGFPLNIGDDVTIGHGVILHACTINSKSLIGIGSIVLDGAIIESNSMIAAGSLISPNKTVESGMLYKGSPAKPSRKLTDKEIEYISFSAKHYVKTMKEHLK
jgi:carbonic anhydrase/acetyltransferase-like protein (isoleucine patch superfamily)|tara:strand:- start:67 stop:594 length:528 start_codon:yes stop_codon:yes gene_type:complete